MSNKSTNTVVTGSTASVATLSYTKATETVTLKVSATDMAIPDADIKYFATTNTTKNDSTTGGTWLKEVGSDNDDYKVINLGGVKVDNAGTDTYSCTYTITLNKEEDDTMIDLLSNGDVILNITGDETATVIGGSNYSLEDLKSNSPKTFTSTFELTSGDPQKTFDANIYLVNKQGTDQSAFAGKNLSLKFTTDAKCDIKKAVTE